MVDSSFLISKLRNTGGKLMKSLIFSLGHSSLTVAWKMNLGSASNLCLEWMMFKHLRRILITDLSKYGVDMLSNISLSKLSSNVKYAKAYKDFDLNEDYMIINEVNTFKPTLSWWSFKCDGYYW